MMPPTGCRLSLYPTPATMKQRACSSNELRLPQEPLPVVNNSLPPLRSRSSIHVASFQNFSPQFGWTVTCDGHRRRSWWRWQLQQLLGLAGQVPSLSFPSLLSSLLPLFWARRQRLPGFWSTLSPRQRLVYTLKTMSQQIFSALKSFCLKV
uniref:Uncharacterized protein n=1 Tax=Arundo donax TaxID=35708 RepID=A0A0A9BQS6_ARUDO